MKLIDASGPIYEGMWSYGPPFPEFKIKELNNPEWVDFTAYSEEFIGLTSATGTYIDGPSHALGLDKSYAIGDIPIEKLFGIDAYVLKFDLEKFVILAGRQENIPKYLSLFDTFMIPSYKEGLPMALLEAMAAGKIIIASDVGEIPKIIESGRNGLLFPSGSLDGLIKVLRKVISDHDKFQSCAIEALKTVERSYSSYMMVERYCLVYDQLLNCSKKL